MRRLTYSLLAFFIPLLCNSQQLSFNHLTTENGLQNGNIRAIHEDHQGFIWIATEDGLHRFDGYDVKVYRHSEGDTTSLSSNFILALYEDSFHNLWLGTIDEGLCLYNRKKDNFTTFKHQPNNPNSLAGNTVRSFFQASDKKIYVGSSGFTAITYQSGHDQPVQIENIQLPSWIKIDPATRILSIIEIRKGVLWLCINNFGVVEYDIREKTFRNTIISELEQNIQTLYIDRKRKLVWAGTWNHGLVVVDPATNRYFWHRHSGRADELPGDLQVAQIKGDSEGNIWIGTDNGLSYFDAENDPYQPGGFVTYLPQKDNPSGILGSSIKAIYLDRSDRVWVGSYFEGINVYEKRAMNFQFLDLGGHTRPEEAFPNVTAIVEQEQGTIWVGCDGLGLFEHTGSLHALGNSKFRHVPLLHPTSNRPITKIKTMVSDKSGNLWIGTWGNGLVVFDTKNKQCRPFSSIFPGADIGNEMLSLYYDEEDVLWIGTFDRGLFRYDIKNNLLENYDAETDHQKNKVDRIYTILKDKNKTLWIGKEAAGLNRVWPERGTYKPVINEALDQASTITALLDDQEGNLWIGALNKGLVKYNLKRGGCTVYGEEQGLANNVIHAILKDNTGRLWLSTNLGISVFDPQKKKFANFNKANGLAGKQFNHGSAAELSDGTMLFGNTRGINSFKPEAYSGNPAFPSVVFTRFSLNNVEQLPQHPLSVLDENITSLSEIKLRHFNNSFSVTYAALDYSFSSQTEFAYKLDGFDHDWQYVGTGRQAAYTNLDPGKYVLKVKASNIEKEWPENSFNLSIIILPAWWQTPLFKAGFIAGIFILAYTFHRVRLNYLVLEKKKLSELVKKKTKNLDRANKILRDKIEEINSINKMILEQKKEISEKNNEIQAQNEELISQNEQIFEQREELIRAQEKLKSINDTLEKLVDEKTEALQSTISKLNKTVFELDRFVYSASHDLMAPLKSIKGLVTLAEMEREQSRMSEYLQHINISILKLEEVIKSLAEYSRNTHEASNIQPINLYELVSEVKSELAFLPNASRVALNSRFSQDTVVYSDRTRLKIILHNLVNNGVKYADFEKKAELNIDFNETADKWKLTVSDNGVGIEDKYLSKVFNMYFRATDTVGGSGLGLFIVKEVVDKLGGSIRVKSELGKGTAFVITLPKRVVEKR